MFSSLFQNNFTDVEKQSEMIRQISAIGDICEIAILEDIMGWLDQSLDLTKMTDRSYRSLLAFFLTDVRAWGGASGQAQLTIDVATAQVSIPAGKYLLSQSGITFKQGNTVNLFQGQSATLNLTQGRTVSFTGTYNAYIQSTLANIDLSTITLTIGGVTINRVQKNGSGVIRPYNGFFPFYFEGTLFVKVYAGPDIPLIEGQAYTLTYNQVDGLSGNIPENSLDSYSEVILDALGHQVTYHFTNAEITNGLDQPQRYELIDLLRYWYYTKDSISKISDYVSWFRIQTEVGDAYAIGDYEEYLITGIMKITGKTQIAALDKSAIPLDEPTLADLDERLALVRDVGVSIYRTPLPTSIIMTVRFKAVAPFDQFKAHADSVIGQYFDLTTVRNSGLSIFDDISVVDITVAVQSGYTPVGLELVAAFFKQVSISMGVGSADFFFFPGKVKKAFTTYKFTRVVGMTTTYYYYKEQDSYSDTLNIIDENDVVVGTHNYLSGEIIFPSNSVFISGGVLEIEGRLSDSGQITSGQLFGYRTLKEIRYESY